MGERKRDGLCSGRCEDTPEVKRKGRGVGVRRSAPSALPLLSPTITPQAFMFI